MKRTSLLAAAVAAAFAAPAASAQTALTISGMVNVTYENVKAGDSTGGDVAGGANNSLKSHDRVRDGGLSNIRFFVSEDLGGGNSAFVQVESAVLQNSDTRNNAAGIGSATSGWGNRNSAIGVRSKAAGRFLIGVWDLHYHELYSIEPGRDVTNAAAGMLGLMQNFGSGFSLSPLIGTRYSNIILWDSPVWSGFSVTAGYARPTDSAPVNSPGDVRDGKKNRAWSIAPRFQSGGFLVRYSYLQDKDIATNATISLAGTPLFGGATVASLSKVTSNRIGARYKFGNGFGIGLGWDSSKWRTATNTAGAQIDVERDVWSLPLTYETGNHMLFGTYAEANDWDGSVGGASWSSSTNPAIGNAAAGSLSFGSETGAKFYALGYSYLLSKRTNVHFTYQRISNDALVRYDFKDNPTGNTAVGADPESWSVGIRHTF
jgi:predicted porin